MRTHCWVDEPVDSLHASALYKPANETFFFGLFAITDVLQLFVSSAV